MIRELLGAIEARSPVVLATVTATNRSVPRRPGSKMLVYVDGSISGTVGGGEMEARVRTEAAEALRDRRPRTIGYSLFDPGSGDPGVCGGEVSLYLEPYMPTSTVYVIGAGHVGKAVVELAAWLGYRVIVWDDRAELLEEIGDADATISGPIGNAIAQIPIDEFTRVVMVTRNVAFDVEILPVLLESAAPTIGLMGSNRRWETTKAKLVEAGVDDSLFAKVDSPIGLEISAETPKEIAVSVLAEVIGYERGS